MKVILLAGGFGTRLSEYTETMPKPMVTIGGGRVLDLTNGLVLIHIDFEP